MRTFVAMGDSFTEGLEDDLGPGGRHRGWADRVAAALATRDGGVRYANLAVRGKLIGQVVADQVPVALTLAAAQEPGGDAGTLVSFHAGANDVLRPRSDVDAILRRYDAAVGRLAEAGLEILLFTVLERAGGSGRTAAHLAGRFGRFNDRVRATADRHGARLVDIGTVTALQDRRLWHEDRLHLAPEGHARVAAAVLEVLGVTEPALLAGEPGWWRLPLPAQARPPRRADLAADVHWVRRYAVPWVGRRLRGVSSGDGMLPKHTELVDVLPTEPAAR